MEQNINKLDESINCKEDSEDQCEPPTCPRCKSVINNPIAEIHYPYDDAYCSSITVNCTCGWNHEFKDVNNDRFDDMPPEVRAEAENWMPKSWIKVLWVLSLIRPVDNDDWCTGTFNDDKMIPDNDDYKYGDQCIYFGKWLDEDLVMCLCPRKCTGGSHRVLNEIFEESRLKRIIRRFWRRITKTDLSSRENWRRYRFKMVKKMDSRIDDSLIRFEKKIRNKVRRDLKTLTLKEINEIEPHNISDPFIPDGYHALKKLINLDEDVKQEVEGIMSWDKRISKKDAFSWGIFNLFCDWTKDEIERIVEERDSEFFMCAGCGVPQRCSGYQCQKLPLEEKK